MNAMTEAQESFKTAYRGRLGTIYDLSYMRMSKVLLALHVIDSFGIELENRDIFDYGFGAGTFFKYCPTSARLHGVEIDPIHVAAVRKHFADRHTRVDLQSIHVDNVAGHPLLSKTYDFILCSHVLQYVEDRALLLARLGNCLKQKGRLLSLVPVNQRVESVHVFDKDPDRDRVCQWAEVAGLRLVHYLEADSWPYWVQGFSGALMRAFNLGMGVAATTLGPNAWKRASEVFACLVPSKPTQAAFLLARQE